LYLSCIIFLVPFGRRLFQIKIGAPNTPYDVFCDFPHYSLTKIRYDPATYAMDVPLHISHNLTFTNYYTNRRYNLSNFYLCLWTMNKYIHKK